MALSKNHIYLASRSPRRAELLKQIGIGFDFLLLREAPPRKPDVDETRLSEENAADYVCRIAKIKAETGYERALQRGLAQFPVLAADTAVAVDQNVLGKPRNLIEAEEMLRMLSGRTHQVFTAVAIAFQKGGAASVRLSVSAVEFRKLEEAEIRSYVASQEAYDKAGSYAVQGKAAVFIPTISGSYSGIMGLPLYETAQLLQEAGVVLFP